MHTARLPYKSFNFKRFRPFSTCKDIDIKLDLLILSVGLYLRNAALLVTTVKSKMTRGEREGVEFGGTREGEIGRKGLKGFALDARLSAQILALQASILA
jgi:hypothetical protein